MVKECLGSRALALFAARLGDIPAERYLSGCLEAPTNLQHQSLTGTQGGLGFQRKILHKEALHTKEVVISFSAANGSNEPLSNHTKNESCLVKSDFKMISV